MMATCDAGELSQRNEERRQLLLSLKVTVEGLLANRAANIWNTYGGLSRLTNIVDKILSHQLRAQKDDTYWNFILGLRVLMPTLAPNLDRYRHLTGDNRIKRGQAWIQDSLQDHSLHLQLKLLLDDSQKSLVNLNYEDEAFVNRSQYAQALLVCLKAVDKNDASVLAEIDPNLLKKHPTRSSRTRRCSLPGGSVSEKENRQIGIYLQTSRSMINRSPESKTISSTSSSGSAQHPQSSAEIKEKAPDELELEDTKVDHRFLSPTHRRTKSDTSILNVADVASCTLKSYTVKDPTMSLQQEDKSDFYVGGERSTVILHIDYNGEHSMESSISGSDITTTHVPAGYDGKTVEESRAMKTRRNVSHVRSLSDFTFYERTTLPLPRSSSAVMDVKVDDQSTLSQEQLEPQDVIRPSRSSFFRRPTQGQSLTSFLSSQDFRTCAELDKENAHFSISEALIAAIEQIKCNRILKEADEEVDESDEEIKHLKQRIRIRRREKLQQREFSHVTQILSDGRTDTNNSPTPSPASSVSSGRSGCQSSDTEHLDTCLSDDCETESKLTTLQESGLSLSMASLYSEADIHRPGSNLQGATKNSDGRTSVTDSTMSYISAESVALSLLRKFSEKQLPKASDLDWLVSEQDAPQSLLPLPTSWPISPDEAENNLLHENTRIRGNLEWAPPRPQIIFNIHPISQRAALLAKQNYRCAGCGTKVEKGFARRYRYCEYLGKLFCQCCHNNHTAVIPGYVLRKWDFTKYPVSNYARDLLDNIQVDPLYDLNDINPNLYRKVRVLALVLGFRQQLVHLKDFVRSCKHAENFQKELNCLPAYLYTNPHVYSLKDLILVKMGDLVARLRNLVTQTLTHITLCPLCQARGFVCEFCKNDQDIIYSFQLSKTVQCPECWSCYHRSCFEPSKCPKCARIEARKIYENQFPDTNSTDEEDIK